MTMRVFELAKYFPSEERYALTDQIRSLRLGGALHANKIPSLNSVSFRPFAPLALSPLFAVTPIQTRCAGSPSGRTGVDNALPRKCR